MVLYNVTIHCTVLFNLRRDFILLISTGSVEENITISGKQENKQICFGVENKSTTSTLAESAERKVIRID